MKVRTRAAMAQRQANEGWRCSDSELLDLSAYVAQVGLEQLHASRQRLSAES